MTYVRYTLWNDLCHLTIALPVPVSIDGNLTCPLPLQIVVPLSTKLGELKDNLGSEDFFGPVSANHQRLFYLGRELKTRGRSLSKLGLGRFKGNRVLHLHVQPEYDTQKSQSSSIKTKKRRRAPAKLPGSASNGNSATILEILSDNDDEVALIENPNERETRARLS